MIKRSHQNAASPEHAAAWLEQPRPGRACSLSSSTTHHVPGKKEAFWERPSRYNSIKAGDFAATTTRHQNQHHTLRGPGSRLFSRPRGCLQSHTKKREDPALPSQPPAQHEATIVCLGSTPRRGLAKQKRTEQELRPQKGL